MDHRSAKRKLLAVGGYSYSAVLGEPERGLQGSGRRWYLLVIVLLYIGLITSFCLNVTLLVRREPERVVRLEGLARTGPGQVVKIIFVWYSNTLLLALIYLHSELLHPFVI